MIIIFSISNEDDKTRPCSNDLSIHCDSKCVENVSTTGHTSIELIVDSNTHGDQCYKENFATRSNQKDYYLNNLEWYRIGACSYHNVYLPKESKSKESGKEIRPYIIKTSFIFILDLLIKRMFEISTSLLFSKFYY